MQLSPSELERVERMLEEGRIRCEPPALSETDRMMARLAPPAPPMVPHAGTEAEHNQASVPDSGPVTEPEAREPFSLGELIEQRKRLLTGGRSLDG